MELRQAIATALAAAACFAGSALPAAAADGPARATPAPAESREPKARAPVASPAPVAEEPEQEATRCKFGRWPAEVDGKPAGLEPGGPTGLYLWHSSKGWHLAVTHPGSENPGGSGGGASAASGPPERMTFAGRIVSKGGEIYGVARRTKRGDRVAFKQNGRRNSVSFRFTNYGHIDGIDFRTRCAPGFGVAASLNGKPLTAEQVWIGADGHHLSNVPFKVMRVW